MLRFKITIVATIVTAVSLATLVGAQECRITPDAQRTEQARNKPCADPWINLAYWDNSAGIDGPKGSGNVAGTQCDPAMYAGGRWNSYQELCEAVRKSRQALSVGGYRYVEKITSDGGKVVALLNGSSEVLGGALIGQDGASIKSTKPADIAAAGGGNIVAAGGGNIVAAGGGNFTIQSGAKKVINLNNGSYLIIK